MDETVPLLEWLERPLPSTQQQEHYLDQNIALLEAEILQRPVGLHPAELHPVNLLTKHQFDQQMLHIFRQDAHMTLSLRIRSKMPTMMPSGEHRLPPISRLSKGS